MVILHDELEDMFDQTLLRPLRWCWLKEIIELAMVFSIVRLLLHIFRNHLRLGCYLGLLTFTYVVLPVRIPFSIQSINIKKCHGRTR